MDVEIKDLSDFLVAYVRKVGPYGKASCEAAYGEMMAWAGANGLLGRQTMATVYWDDPKVTPPEKCRTDACITLPPGMPPDPAMSYQRIGAGPHAVCHFEMSIEGFAKAWKDAFAWFAANGCESDDRPCFERYNVMPQDPRGTWSVDICLPLKKK